MKKNDLTSLVVNFTEWFSSIVILNLCWLLFSLPLITIIPATDVVFEMIYQWKTTEKPKEIFKEFKFNFLKHFKKSYRLDLPILIVLLIIGIDVYFLNRLTIDTAWFQILKYAFYTLAVMVLLTVLFSYCLSKVLENTSFQIFLIGFLLLIGKPIITLAVVASLLLMIIIISIFPSMLFFISMSGIAWLGMTAVFYSLEDKEND